MAEMDTATRKDESVWHISLHTFTPVKNGVVRKADIGLLYDPGRRSEKAMCTYLGDFLKERAGEIRVRRNYPYLGKTDGFTTFLRKRYPDELYAGIEIEINQGLLFKNPKNKEIKMVLQEGIRNILQRQEFFML